MDIKSKSDIDIKDLKEKSSKYLCIIKDIFYKFFNFILVAFIIFSVFAYNNMLNVSRYEQDKNYAKNQVSLEYFPENWIANYATVTNVDIYRETSYLSKLKELPQEELNVLGKSLGSKYVKYLIYDVKTNKYLTNDGDYSVERYIINRNGGNRRVDAIEEIENRVANGTAIRGFSYASYSKNSLAVQNFSDHLNYIKTPNDFIELYWISGYSSDDLVSKGLAVENRFTNWPRVERDNQLIAKAKVFLSIYFLIGIIFVTLFVITGSKKLMLKLKDNIVVKIVKNISGLFGVVSLGVKFIIFLVFTIAAFINTYIFIQRGYFYDIYYNFHLWVLLYIIIPSLYVIFILPKAVKFISRINSMIIGTTKIVEGDLEINLEEKGEKNLAKLAHNINKIKTGFKVSVDEQIKNERLKSELVTNVSHDLKTPLTSIINYIDILQRKDITEEEKEDYLKILNTKSYRLKLLIDDLFEVSKMNSGKVELEKEEVDIVELLQQALGEFSNLYQHRNIMFKVNSFKDSIIMNLDGKKISRVFENLISNALKYSMENTRVYIDIKENDTGITLSFKNISAYEIDFETAELFERFKRADESRTSSVEGSGLGLAIARSIIDLHGGSMSIEVEGDLFKVFINLK